MIKKKILVTGCAGFIGFHLSKQLSENFQVIGIDNVNNYYDINLKKNRLKILKKNKNFTFHKCDISKYKQLNTIFNKYKFEYIIHLAAQAGVRYSISHPDEYFNSNILGFYNLIKNIKKIKIKHFLFASTSSVYGTQKSFPIKETANSDFPLSFYAASKKTNEVMAYSYSNMFKIPSTCLRFFTVYGPYGRPDMSLYKFIDKLFKNQKLPIYNKGNHIRDFTYVDDVVANIKILLNHPPTSKNNYYQFFNVCGSDPRSLNDYLKVISKIANKKMYKKFLPLQKGDVFKTFGDNSKIMKITKYKKFSNIENGIKKFIDWFQNK